MDAWKLLDAAPFDPVTVQALKQAFDEAWAIVSPKVDPADIEHARLRLAHAIVAHAHTPGVGNLEALKAAAIKAFQRPP